MNIGRSRAWVWFWILIVGLPWDGDSAEPYDRRTPIVQAVEKVLPSVVNIQTSKNIKQTVKPFMFPFDDVFEQSYRLEGLGSGVLIEGGYVITNNHVIEYDQGTADTIYVTFHNDDEQRQATVIGNDPTADVAILKLEGETTKRGLPWGRSDDLMIGETVIAVGNALGQPFTVTNGIISALNRTIEEDNGNTLYSLIQTNADINRGNSGGPLVNINGEFIGLNTAILSPSGGSVGLGFAIPVTRVKKIYDYWIKGVISLEDRLGLKVQDLTPPIKDFFRTHYDTVTETDLHGVVVLTASPEGLSKDILQRQDVILSVDGRSIQNSNELYGNLENHQGPLLKMEIIRKGEKQTVQISVPNKQVERLRADGIEMQALDNPWRRRLGLEDSMNGVVVLSVDEGTLAAKAGLRRGDLITGYGRKIDARRAQVLGEIKSLQDVSSYLKTDTNSKGTGLVANRKEGKEWNTFLVTSDGATAT